VRVRVRVDRVGLVLPFVMALAACGDEPTPGAPSPAPAAATVRSIQVSPSQLTLATGQTEQLSATASMSDGSSRSVDTEVIWVAPDPHLATVSGRGVVTAHAYGTTLLFARLGERTSNLARLTVPVPPELLVPLTGVLRDQWRVPVRGAVIAILQGEGLHPAMTDDNGFFDLGSTYGLVRLAFARFGYDDLRLTVSDVGVRRQLEVTITENPSPAIERSFDVTFSDTASVPVRHRIVTRAGGTVDVLVQAEVCGEGDVGFADVQLRSGGVVVAADRLGACRYRLKAAVPEAECRLEIDSRRPGRSRVTLREPR
jgi:hypothetical protein